MLALVPAGGYTGWVGWAYKPKACRILLTKKNRGDQAAVRPVPVGVWPVVVRTQKNECGES